MMNLGKEYLSMTIDIIMITGVLTPSQLVRSKESTTNA